MGLEESSKWNSAAVGDLFDIQLGKMLSSKAKQGTDPYPYLGNKNVQWNSVKLEDLSWMDFTPKERVKFSLEPGDLLVCEGGEVGRTAIWNGEKSDCFYQKAIHRLRPKTNSILPRFMMRYMRYAADRGLFAKLTSQTSIAHLTREKLSLFQVPLPPVAEQERIAAILDKADAIRRRRQRGIALSEDLLRSTFLEMFGDPIANPNGHDVKSLGDLCADLAYGTSVKCGVDPLDDRLPVLRIPNVLGGEIDWSELKYARVSSKERERLALAKGDILFVRTNGNPAYIARCAVFRSTREALFASYLIRARLKGSSNCEPEFLQACFSADSYRSRLLKIARTTAGNYNVSGSSLKSLEIPVPPLELQRKFVEFLTSLRLMQVRHAEARDHSDDLFGSLSQRAFRGEL